ncbi:MAG: AmmeMemoRadiSam system protein B [Chloroflexota bacterium]
MNPGVEHVRPSPIAGQWYPGDAHRLAALVDRYINEARLPALDGEVVAVVAPHAGHQFSGPVAGHAFAAVRGRPVETVVIIAPLHQPVSPAPLVTTAHQAYWTPLGAVPVDQAAVQELDGYLKQAAGIGLAAIANDREHSLEIELPFLQRALPGPFTLVPVMMREQDQPVARALGAALARLLQEGQALRGKRALLVASSDLSHFFPQKVAQALDQEMLRQVAAFDPAGVIRVEQEGRAFACGHGAVAAVLWAAQQLGARQAQVVNYATSGDVTGRTDEVVGYAAAVVTRPGSE